MLILRVSSAQHIRSLIYRCMIEQSSPIRFVVLSPRLGSFTDFVLSGVICLVFFFSRRKPLFLRAGRTKVFRNVRAPSVPWPKSCTERASIVLIVHNMFFFAAEHEETDGRREQTEDYLTDQVETAHNLITKLRQLLTMEKTDAVMDRSLNRTRFFKMDDDQRK